MSSFSASAIWLTFNAMVDVEITLELARQFIKEKKMWGYLTEYFQKKIDIDRIKKIPVTFESKMGEHCFALATGSIYGSQLNFQSPVLSIGNPISYSNQSLWLRLDQPEFCKTTLDNIAENTWCVRKRFGEPDIILPPADRFIRLLSKERKNIIEENLKWIKSNTDIFEEIITYYRNFKYPLIPDLDADAALYQNGFLSSKDQKSCTIFHRADLAEKESIISNFIDKDTQKLAYRLLFRNYPDNLSSKTSQQMTDFLKKVNPENQENRIVNYKNEKRTTPISALKKIKSIFENKEIKLDDEQVKLFDELEEYIREIY